MPAAPARSTTPPSATMLKYSAAVTVGSVVAGIGYASLIERNAFVVREVTMPVLSPGSSPLPKGSGVFPGRRLRRYSSRLTCGLSPEAQRVLYQLAARSAFSLLRPHNEAGDKPVECGENAEFA